MRARSKERREARSEATTAEGAKRIPRIRKGWFWTGVLLTGRSINTIFTRFARRRFTGEDIEGLTEDDLPIPDTFLQIYAETKALGEKGENDDGCKGFCFLLSSNPK